MLEDPLPGEDDAASQNSSSACEVSLGAEETGAPKRTKKEKKKDRKRTKAVEKDKEMSKVAQATASTAKEAVPSSAAASSAAAAPTLATQEKEDEDQPRYRRKGLDLDADPKHKTTKPRNKVFNSDQAKLMILIMKMVLSSHQLGREITSILFDCYLCPREHPAVAAMKKQGKRYSIAVQTKGHGLGNPWLYVYGSLLNHLALGMGAETADFTHYTQYSKLALEERGEIIKLCKVVDTYREDSSKILLSYGNGPEALALRKHVHCKLSALEGFVFRQGKAPASNMERVLQAWVQDLVS